MDEKELQALYKAMSARFDIGGYDTFKAKMQTPADRKRFYTAISDNGFDLGDYDTYEQRLAGVKKKEVSAASLVGQSVGLAAGSGDGKVTQLEEKPEVLDPKDPLKSALNPIRERLTELRQRPAAESTGQNGIAKQVASERVDKMLQKKETIEKSGFGNVEEAKGFLKSVIDPSKLVLKGPIDITKAPDLEDYTEESVAAAVKGNETAELIALPHVKRVKDAKDALENSVDLGEAAIKLAIKKGGITGDQINFLESNIPQSMKGMLLMQALNDPGLKELASRDQELTQKINTEIYNFPDRYPAAAIRILSEKISQKMEDEGRTSWFFNAPGAKKVDEMANKIFESGELPVQYKNLYDDPAVRFYIMHNLKTPGIVEGTAENIGTALEGYGKSAAELTGIRGLYKSKQDQLFQALDKDYQDYQFDPKGLLHNISHAGGIVIGQIIPMAAGGNILLASKLVKSTKTANAIMAGLQSFGYNKEQALKDLPGESELIQLGYAGLNTGFEIATENLTDDTKITRDLMRGIRPKVKTIITKFGNKEISAEVAQNQVNNLGKSILSFVQKAGKFGKGAVGVAKREANEEAFSKILQSTNRQLFGGMQESLLKTAEDAFEVWKTTFMGSLFFGMAGGMNAARSNPGTTDVVYDVAGKPDYYKEMIRGQIALDEEFSGTGEQAIKNIDHAAAVRKEVDQRTDLNEKQKKQLVITSLNKKVLEEKAASSPDKSLNGNIEKQIVEVEIEQKKILNPEMANTVLVKEFFENDLLGKGSKESLSIRDADGKPTNKFDENKVGDYLKFVAQQANNLDENWQPHEGKAPDISQIPAAIVEVANKRWEKEIGAAAEKITGHMKFGEEEVPEIITSTTWYRGVNKNNQKKGDRFFSADESVAGDYAVDKISDQPKMTTLQESEKPKNPLVVGTKEDLAEEMGYPEENIYDLDGSFDNEAKEYAQSKGYDAIVYQSGSMDAPELHLFGGNAGVVIDSEEVQRQMQPFTDKMADIESQFEADGYSIDWDYDGEISVTDKNGNPVEPGDLPENLLELAGDYEVATMNLMGYNDSDFIKSLDKSRKKIRGEEAEFEVVGTPIPSQNKEVELNDKFTAKGGNKVVSENGSPLVVYHGTTADISKGFQPKDFGTHGKHEYYYFAKSKSWVNKFKEQEKISNKESFRVYEFIISLKKPIDIRNKFLSIDKWVSYFKHNGVELSKETVKDWESRSKNAPRYEVSGWQLLRFDNGLFRGDLIKSGYDGLIISDVNRGKMDNTVYVALKNEQIQKITKPKSSNTLKKEYEIKSEEVAGKEQVGSVVDEGVATPATSGTTVSEPTKQAPPAKEQSWKSASGQYRVEYKDGKRIVKFRNGRVMSPTITKDVVIKSGPRKGGVEKQTVTNPKHTAILLQHAKSYNYDFGERVSDRAAEQQFNNEQEASQWVIENSSNPAEIAEVWMNEQRQPVQLSSKDAAIAQVIGKVNAKSFNRHGDRNRVTGAIAKTYFSKDGRSVDDVANQASNYGDGNEVTPDDVISFMETFPYGVDPDGTEKTEVHRNAESKFQELTGIPLNKTTAAIAAKQNYSPEQIAETESEVDNESERELDEDEINTLLDQDVQEFDNLETFENEPDEFLEEDTAAPETSTPDTTADEGGGQVSKGKASAQKSTAKQKAKELADKIRGLKIDLSKFSDGGAQSNVAGIPVAIYNATIDTIAKLVEAGGSLFDAIQEAIDKHNLNDIKSFNEDDFVGLIYDSTGQNVPESEPEEFSVFKEPQKKVIAEKGAKIIPAKEADVIVKSWKDEAKRIGREEDRSKEVIISMYDYTGSWSKPFQDAGYTVIMLDIQHEKLDAYDDAEQIAETIQRGDKLIKIGGDILENFPFIINSINDAIKASGKKVKGLLSATPCTTFAGSGARWWPSHDKVSFKNTFDKYGSFAAKNFESPNDYNMALVDATEEFIAVSKPEFYSMENPVGRIGSLKDLPEPTLTFHPNIYGDPYTKKTQLWGVFNPDLPQAAVDPVEGSKMQSKLGSKNKIERSLTPEGFAYSYFIANVPNEINGVPKLPQFKERLARPVNEAKDVVIEEAEEVIPAKNINELLSRLDTLDGKSLYDMVQWVNELLDFAEKTNNDNLLKAWDRWTEAYNSGENLGKPWDMLETAVRKEADRINNATGSTSKINELKIAQKNYEDAVSALTKAEAKLAKEQGTQKSMFGSEGTQQGLFGVSKSDVLDILDPLRKKVKLAKEALDKADREAQAEGQNQPKLSFADKLHDLADKIRNTNLSGDAGTAMTDISAIPRHVIALAIDGLAVAVEAGTRLKVAIEDAVNYIMGHKDTPAGIDPDDVTAYVNKQIQTLTGVNPNPKPQTGNAAALSTQKFDNALADPKSDKKGFFSKIGDFFKNLSYFIDNPNRYITRLQRDVENYYDVKTGKISLGRIFEQNVRGKGILKVQEFVNQVLKGLNKKGLQDFHRYIFARRVQDRYEQEMINRVTGKDTPSRETGNITHQDAINELDALAKRLGPKKMADFERRADNMQRIMDEALLQLVAGGVLSKEAYNDIKSQNDFYAPFNVAQTLVRQSDGVDRPAVASTVVKRIKGISFKPGESAIGDIDVLQDALEDGTITKEEFFESAQAILDDLLNTGKITDAEYAEEMGSLANSGFTISNIFDKAANIIFDAVRISHRNELLNRVADLQKYDKEGLFVKPVDGFELRYDKDGEAFMVPKRIEDIKVEKGFGVVGFRTDGKPKFLAIDEKAAKTINGLDRVELPFWMKGINAINSIFRTAVITLSPAFQYANFIIDFMRSAAMNKYGLLTGRNIGDSLANAVLFIPQYIEAIVTAGLANFGGKNTKLYEEFMKSKGYSSGMYDDPFQANKRQLKVAPQSAWSAVKKSLGYIFTIPEKIGRTLEQSHKIVSTQRGMDVEAGIRVGLARMKNLLSKADSPQSMADALDQVAYETQNFAGSPNFPATHSSMKMLSVIFQFLSARVKGEMTDYRRFATMLGSGAEGRKVTAAERAQFIAQFTATTALPIVLMALVNNTDDEDEKQFKTMSEPDRNNNINIPYGIFEYEHDDGTKETYRDYIKIPVRGLPATMNTIANDAVQFYKSKDKKLLKHAVAQTLANISPINLQGETGSEMMESLIANMTPLPKWYLEFATNRDTYRHRDLISDMFGQNGVLEQYLRGDKEPYEVANKRTPQWAIDVSKWLYDEYQIKITPITLDHIENTFLGNISDVTKPNFMSRRMLRSESNFPVWEQK